MPVAVRSLSPTDVDTRRRRQLACASREAEGYLELGMARNALHALQRRGALVFGDGRACYLLGESLREMSRFREAVSPLRRSVSLTPGETSTWLALGWCYKRIGRIHDAVAALERAVSIAPGDAILHYNLACYYCLADRRLDALRRLRTAFRLDATLIELVGGEEDFARLHADPAYRMLLRAVS